MFNIAPALYGQSDKYIQVWIYIYAHIGEGAVFTNDDIYKACNISRQGLSDILNRGVTVFNQKGIPITIERDTPTSKFFKIGHDGLSVPQASKAVAVKRPKAETPEAGEYELAENVIITHLNEKTGKAYRVNNKATLKLIHARLKEGFTVEQFKHVIDVKTHKWKDTEYQQYLRPETLFGNKFETYLNENINDQQDNTTSAKRIRNAQSIITEDWGILREPKGD
jgi:uncharacterized phage protein (TIGR02220 family)